MRQGQWATVWADAICAGQPQAAAPHPLSHHMLTSPWQDHPHGTDGHAPEPASGQGSRCDSPKQAAGQESPPLPVTSAVKVTPVPPGSPVEGVSPGHPALSQPVVPLCCTPHVGGLGGCS